MSLTPKLRPNERAMGVSRELLGENRPRYIRSALYTPGTVTLRGGGGGGGGGGGIHLLHPCVQHVLQWRWNQYKRNLNVIETLP